VRVLTQAVYAYSACAEERRREATMRGGEAGWFRVVKGGSGVSMSGLHPPPLSLYPTRAHTRIDKVKHLIVQGLGVGV